MVSNSRRRGRPRPQRMRAVGFPAALFCLLVSGEVSAQFVVQPRFDSYGDFGGAGLLQMPTARFLPEGEFAFSSARTSPYIRTAVTMQPVPWFEGVIRYTTVLDRLYGREDFSGKQTYKDKGLDVKIRLLEESALFPQIAVGLRDVGGTGLFASEYLVASRRWHDFDFSLGLGWGNMGTRGQLKNPLTIISSRFKNRQNNVGEGGTLATQSYFRGERASVIGGVTWQTPVKGLTVKLELDGNNYSNEYAARKITPSSPLNAGMTYSWDDWLDLSIGIERGNALMAQLVLHGNLQKGMGMPKMDPPPEPLKPRDFSQNVEWRRKQRDEGQTVPEIDLARVLGEKGFKVEAALIDDRRAFVEASQKTYRNTARAIGRAARIMANNLPPDVEELTFVSREKGLETQRVSLMRKDLEKAVRYEGSPEEMAMHLRTSGPNNGSDARLLNIPGQYPAFNWSWSPSMKHQIGGPDKAYFYQFYLRADAEYQITRHLGISAAATFNVADNLADLKLDSDSVLPHVRSDIKEYLKQGKNGLAQLQLDYLTNLGRHWYGRASAGIFEEMFGGISGEVLYRPYDSRWALGVELNRVQQRSFKQLLSFRDYRVNTGHVDVYYRLPFHNLSLQVSAGQYLAGDRGATVMVSRQFDSGAVLGAFATKTNVSAAQFGEGSFDKGFFISVPVDMLSLYSSRGSIGMAWRPLTRDGGQRLGVSKRLYRLVSDYNPDRLRDDWRQVLE